MIAPLNLPATLMGQPLSACGVPGALAQLLALHGKSVADPIGESWTDNGPFSVTLQNEFREAAGYRFEWCWVIPSMPRWYIDQGKSAPVAWRFVPVALWQEFAQTQRLLETVPALLQVAARPVLDCIVQAEHSRLAPGSLKTTRLSTCLMRAWNARCRTICAHSGRIRTPRRMARRWRDGSNMISCRSACRRSCGC